MGQFFATNASARPAAGPKEGRWSRETPSDWRSALGVTAPAEAAAAEPSEEKDSSGSSAA